LLYTQDPDTFHNTEQSRTLLHEAVSPNIGQVFLAKLSGELNLLESPVIFRKMIANHSGFFEIKTVGYSRALRQGVSRETTIYQQNGLQGNCNSPAADHFGKKYFPAKVLRMIPSPLPVQILDGEKTCQMSSLSILSITLHGLSNKQT